MVNQSNQKLTYNKSAYDEIFLKLIDFGLYRHGWVENGITVTILLVKLFIRFFWTACTHWYPTPNVVGISYEILGFSLENPRNSLEVHASFGKGIIAFSSAYLVILSMEQGNGFSSRKPSNFHCDHHYYLPVLTCMLLVSNLAKSNRGIKPKRNTETLAHGFSSESTQKELSNEYQHDRVWTKVASSLEWLMSKQRYSCSEPCGYWPEQLSE